jgi:bifunctional DNase/RNase
MARGSRELEAAALAVAMESVETPRPMSYQLMHSHVASTGGEVRDVRVTRLDEGTFYAEVLVSGAAGDQEVDARPSDAFNLALVADCPILVDESVLEEPSASRYDEWSRDPESSSDRAADVRQQQAKMRGPLEMLRREARQRQRGQYRLTSTGSQPPRRPAFPTCGNCWPQASAPRQPERFSCRPNQPGSQKR